jgi:tetratricopeptide (TPR) repeat protein
MSKSQIIIIITGVISVILLFNLPKVIVKTDKKLEEAKPEKEASSDEHTDLNEHHKAELSEKEANAISSLRNSLNTVSNKEKRSNFADSLVKAFRKVYQYDSAAKYSELFSEMKPNSKNWESTADLFIEAANFAENEKRSIFNEKARLYYNKILEKSPDNYEVKSKLAMTYVGGDNPMQGIKILRDILKADAKNESALYSLGILSIQSGQHDKAVKRFEELLEVNPKHATGQFYLGVAWANLGDNSKAIEAFKKAKQLDTDPEFTATVDSYMKELQ